MPSVLHILFRLTLSAILGGIVGMERESLNRPAGLRTHILVCVGSSLIMISGIHLFYTFQSYTNVDPGRLAAQIVSGIGFLGAGTIIKEGSTVRGLTTAASLWTVSGIGIAIGSGFYFGGLMATLLVLITLVVFSKFERYLSRRHNETWILVRVVNKPGKVGLIGTELGRMNISIINIKMEPIEDTDDLYIKFNLLIPRNLSISSIIERITYLNGVHSVESCSF